MEVVSCALLNDPFQELDDDENTEALQDLIDKLPTSNLTCSAQEYTNDEDLPICQEMDDDEWENNFMNELRHEDMEEEHADSENDDQDSFDLPSSNSTSSIKTYKDAITALEDIQCFLQDKGHINTSMQHIGPAVDALVSLRTSSLRQPTLCDYFN